MTNDLGADHTGTLEVPGASLHYRVRGSGPFVVILQGGDGAADASEALVDQLAAHHTVVTYDRRGLSRSPLRDPEQPMRLEIHADDVHHLLEALTEEPAAVFGCSIGALIGLELVSRHPEQIRTLVAHEPPAHQLLPEAEKAQVMQFKLELEAAYRSSGVMGALPIFLAMTGVSFEDREADVVLPRPTPQRMANLEFFLTRDSGAVDQFRLDLEALKRSATRIVPAAGSSSRRVWTYHCAHQLAGLLGRDLIEFPGGHSGYVYRPKAFGAQLLAVFADR